MVCFSSIAGLIRRTVSEAALFLVLGDPFTRLNTWLGSIKKGNRKSEILLRDAEVGVDRAMSWVNRGSDWSR